MALEREIYKAFESIVGENNISDDPGILETYRCAAAQSSAHYGPYDHRTPMPQAAIMPGSTKEVQSVILLCNKYRIKYKASTTFWSAHGYIGSDDAVQIDMRRMKKFEIDAKNMIMTVEPYVIAASAHAEAIKVGLVCNIPGVGSSSSIVANTSGWGGAGPSTIYAGTASENLLCAEWVLPNGDIVYSGSAGAGAGWFCGDGPGPSVRALFRGGSGTMSEMGICTRLSFKLSPWAGPPELASDGSPPAYRAKLPGNFKAYALCFPDWDKWAQAMMALAEAEIVFTGHRQFSMFGRDIKAAMIEILNDPDKQLCDLPALMEDPKVRATNESLTREMYIVIMGMTPADMAWKEAAVDRILELYDGWKDHRCLDPEVMEWLLMYFVRMGHKNLNYALCGAYEGHFGLLGSNLLYSASICEEASMLKKEWEQKGDFIAAVGGDSTMGGLTSIGGGGGPMLWEYFAHFDAHDKASIAQTREYISNISQGFQTAKGLGPDFCRMAANFRREDGYSFTQEEHNAIFAKAAHREPQLYQWKLREAFNPNHLGSSYYETLDPAYKATE
jgi:glycolate oxidase